MPECLDRNVSNKPVSSQYRFSKDVYTVDEQLPMTLRSYFGTRKSYMCSYAPVIFLLTSKYMLSFDTSVESYECHTVYFICNASIYIGFGSNIWVLLPRTALFH